MNISHLEAFVAVVEQGGFHQAAHTIHRSQPAVTKSIKTLEFQLGLTLFDRTQYRVTLTEAGKKIYQESKQVLKQIERFSQCSSLLSEGIETEIKIAVDILYPLDRIADVINDFILTYPSTNFTIYSDILGGACERLLDNAVDIAISENLISEMAIDSVPLQDILLLPVANHLYFQEHYLHFEDPNNLNQTMQIVLSDTSRQQKKHSWGIVPNTQKWTVTDLQSKRQLIESGYGWGSLPEYMIAEKIKSGKLKVLDYPHIQKKCVPMSLLRKPDRIPGPILSLLLEKLE